MLNRNFMIVNRLGLHARAAAQFVQTASKFRAEVTLTKDDVEVNGKSIMGILLLLRPREQRCLLPLMVMMKSRQ